MTNKNYQTFFDCGFSKIRAGVFNKDNFNEAFYSESEFSINHINLESKIQKMITSLEKDTKEYINNVSLMIDSPKMLSIGISVSKKLNGLNLKETNVQFLIQEAKQQILKNYINYNIAHIIINNYKIDDNDYSYLPDNIKCNFISLDIVFICLPSDLVLYFKNIFSKSNVLINQVICSSYVKSINYKDNQSLTGHVLFIDIGFNKTSTLSYYNDKMLSLNVLPIGGNHITKDISKILDIDLEQAEKIKCNLNYDHKIPNNHNFSIEMIHRIVFARTEEILELCIKPTESNSLSFGKFRMIIMGAGLKILDKRNKDKISLPNNIDFLDETLENICRSGFRFGMGLNKQEVVVVPKKLIKQGFFEKLFHFFS